MDLAALLDRDAESVVGEASEALARSGPNHYREISAQERQRRLQSLFDVVRQAINSRDLSPVIVYGEQVARERHDAHVDIAEVQTAFNVLEEALWRRTTAEVPPDELPAAIGMLATAVGVGKDALARTYVALESQRRVPSLDMRALFDGTQPEAAYHDYRDGDR